MKSVTDNKRTVESDVENTLSTDDHHGIITAKENDIQECKIKSSAGIQNIDINVADTSKHNCFQHALFGATQTITSIADIHVSNKTFSSDEDLLKSTEQECSMDIKSIDKKDTKNMKSPEILSLIITKKNNEILKQGETIVNQDKQVCSLRATILRQEGIILQLEENNQSLNKKAKLHEEDQDRQILKQEGIIQDQEARIIQQDSLILCLNNKSSVQKEKIQEQDQENLGNGKRIQKQIQELTEYSTLCASLKFLLSQPRSHSEDGSNQYISEEGLNLHQMQALDLAGIQHPPRYKNIKKKFVYQKKEVDIYFKDDQNDKHSDPQSYDYDESYDYDDYAIQYQFCKPRRRTNSQFYLKQDEETMLEQNNLSSHDDGFIHSMLEREVKPSQSQTQQTSQHISLAISVRQKERQKPLSKGDILISRNRSSSQESRSSSRKQISFSRKGTKVESKERVTKLLKACYKVYI